MAMQRRVLAADAETEQAGWMPLGCYISAVILRRCDKEWRECAEVREIKGRREVD